MGALTTGSSAWVRLLAAFGVAALALSLMPLVSASAQDNDDYPTYDDYPGEPGNIIEREAEDGLPATVRYRGSSRHDTAGQIATDDQTYYESDGFRDSDEVILARADDFPDSLAGAYVSLLLDAPLLLVDTVGSIEPNTAAALEAIDPETVTVLGGTSAISDQAANDAAAIGSQTSGIERIAGSTRFETAEEIAGAGDVAEVGGDRTAFLATGLDFADALAAGQIAAFDEHPILLTTPDELHSAADRALDDQDVDQVIILGGTAAISDDVENQVEAKGISTIRLGDADRAGTATKVAQFAIDTFDFDPAHLNVATGFNFPDALAMGPHAGLEGSPLILARGDDFLDGAAGNETQPSEFIAEYACETGAVHIAGGHNALSTGVEDEIREASDCPPVPFLLSLTPETATNAVGDDHELTVAILDLDGETITADAEETTVELLIESATAGLAPTTVETQTAQLGADGEATFTIDDPGEATVYQFTATAEFEDESLSATATKAWVEDFDSVATISSEREVGESFADDPNPLGPAGGASYGELNVEVVVSDDGGEVTSELCVAYVIGNVGGSYEAFADAAGISAAHIHLGDYATNGPVVQLLSTPEQSDVWQDVLDFDPLGGMPTDAVDMDDDPFGYNSECIEIDGELAAGIANSPDQYYFNAHTDAWPGGNTRGQLDGSWDDEERFDTDPVDLGD